MKKSFIIGLTGPTGAGKSTICAVLSDYGFVTVDADVIAKKAMSAGSPLISALTQKFGSDIISSDGELNRVLLADRAFANAESTKALNAITHPAILNAVKEQIEALAAAGNNKIILDAPQLFEAGAQDLCDFILSVLATRETRVFRIMNRDAITREQALKRINAQKSDEFFVENSDFVIYNDSDLCTVNTQIATLLQKLQKFVEDVRI